MRWMDTIAIRRRGYDKEAFQTAARALAEGQNVFMFPEGTRRPVGRPGPVKGGLGLLVQESHVPILPIFVRGTCSLRPGGHPRVPFEVRYGPLMRLHALDRLCRDHGPREISRRISTLFLAVFLELQARSHAETPETPEERRIGLRRASRMRGKIPPG